MEYLKLLSKNLSRRFSKNLIVMGRNIEITIEKDGYVKASYKVPYGTKLFVRPDQPVKKNQKICEWDPYTLPVIAETAGIVNYVDLVMAHRFQIRQMKTQEYHLK